MVTDDGRVKILDFGLAKLLEPAEAYRRRGTRTAPLTEAGMVVGTAAYMSPEQAEGRKVDARSDIFSFGSVLYEMVTGRRPFAGESPLSVLAKILNEDPAPPSQVAASVPPDVERAILRCLRKDPARRYQTMADLKVALEDLSEESAAGQPAQSPARRAARRWRWAWAALVPVLLAGAYFVWQARATAGQVRRRCGRCRSPRFPASCVTRRSRPTATTSRSHGTARSRTTPTSTCSRLAPVLRYG